MNNSALEVAKNSLFQNLHKIEGKSYLLAGPHQFASLWTRDFCHSISALLKMNLPHVVYDHLNLLMQLQNHEGLIPRIIDHLRPEVRVIKNCLHQFTASVKPPPPPQTPLNAYYHDEHGSKAIDSNLLYILGCLDYLEFIKNKSTLPNFPPGKLKKSLSKALLYYQIHIDPQDGLLRQSSFSDWQDSVRRVGKTSYTNFLYLHTIQRLWEYEKKDSSFLEKTSIPLSEQKELLEKNIFKLFYNSDIGLFRSLTGREYYSLDANLMCLDFDLFSDQIDFKKLWSSIKKSELIQIKKSHHLGITSSQVLTPCTYPIYPFFWHSSASMISGIFNYHDQNIWSWLMAYTGVIAYKMKDAELALEIKRQVSDLLVRDQTVNEVFANQENLTPLQTYLYKSEAPFSWGAAYILRLLYSSDD